MATTPVTPVQQPLVTSIDKDTLDALHALAGKHVTVSYTLIGLVFFLVLCIGAGGWFALKMYDQEIARAEAAEKTAVEAQNLMLQYKQSSDAALKAAQDQIVQDQAQRAQDVVQIASLTVKIQQRDTAANAAIAAAKDPNKSLTQSAGDLTAVYKGSPDFLSVLPLTPDGSFIELNKTQAQDITVTKLDDDKVNADLKDTQTQLSTSQHDVTTLQNDLNLGTEAFTSLQKTEEQCEVTVTDKQKALDDYKKAAIKSKWQKFLIGAEKVSIFIGGVALGHRF